MAEPAYIEPPTEPDYVGWGAAPTTPMERRALMSISAGTYFKVECDDCGEAFPEHESGGGFTLYDSEEEARREVESWDGEIAEDGKTYCAGCTYERRAADQLSDRGKATDA